MKAIANAGREYFEMGARDMARAESAYPGRLRSLLTHPIQGLERCQEPFEKLDRPGGAIEVFCEVAPP